MLSTPPGEAENAEPERRRVWFYLAGWNKVASVVGLAFFVGWGGYVAVHADSHPVAAAAWLSLAGLVMAGMGDARAWAKKAEAEA